MHEGQAVAASAVLITALPPRLANHLDMHEGQAVAASAVNVVLMTVEGSEKQVAEEVVAGQYRPNNS